MSKNPNDRPYVQTWLKRLDRQLSGSGRVSQIALALSQKRGGSSEDWGRQLRAILDGSLHPNAELIADIDQLLAKPISDKPDRNDSQGRLL